MTDWWSRSPEPIRVPSGGRIDGRASVPGSKSLTHRAYAVALLARRPTVLVGALDAEDTRLFERALEALGYDVARSGERVRVRPTGRVVERGEIFCGNAGTLFRFLVALLATVPGEWIVDGTPRLRERPVGPLVDALVPLGVEIDWIEEPGHAPLRLHGGSLAGGLTALDAGESSQYLSALLLAGQRAAAPIEIEVERLVSSPYVDLTIDLLLAQGGIVERPEEGLYRTEPAALVGGEIAIEPDLSAAAYPAAAAALSGGDILIERVRLDSRQADRRLLELLARMGAEVTVEPEGVRVAGGALAAVTADLSEFPDQVPTLAALAPFARGTTRIENVAHLRIKESDRLAAMASELRRAGAEVEELADGLVIPGVWAEAPPPADPVVVEPHDDHRIAMAMALVALRRPNLSISNPQCVAKSYPLFWRDLAHWLGADDDDEGKRRPNRASDP